MFRLWLWRVRCLTLDGSTCLLSGNGWLHKLWSPGWKSYVHLHSAQNALESLMLNQRSLHWKCTKCRVCLNSTKCDKHWYETAGQSDTEDKQRQYQSNNSSRDEMKQSCKAGQHENYRSIIIIIIAHLCRNKMEHRKSRANAQDLEGSINMTTPPPQRRSQWPAGSDNKQQGYTR